MSKTTVPITDMIGKTVVGITSKIHEIRDPEGFIAVLVFETDDYTYRMYQEFNCHLEEAALEYSGNLEDLVGKPILNAYVSTSDAKGILEYSCLFCHLVTIKGSVALGWHEYYSEGLGIERTEQ